MNETHIMQKGIKPLHRIVDRWQHALPPMKDSVSPHGLAKLMVSAHEIDVSVFFFVYPSTDDKNSTRKILRIEQFG
jgi:hypothetical protein